MIALGGNDSRDISGNCVPNAVKNIRAMIAGLFGAIPILLAGPANIRKDTLGPTKPIANERDQNLRDLNAAYEKLARNYLMSPVRPSMEPFLPRASPRTACIPMQRETGPSPRGCWKR